MSMKKVFLDTNTVFELGKTPRGPVYSRVIDLIESEQIRMLTTNVTVAEAIKLHTRRDFKEMKCICSLKLRNLVEETIDTEFPEISEKQLWEVLKEKYRHVINNLFKEMDTKILSINDVNSNDVFWDYFNESGFFFDGGKKHQFPDAFAFECLKDEASQDEPIIVVSKDKDFEQPIDDQKHITLVESLSDLFSELGLKLEDPDIAQFLEQNYDEIKRMVRNELSNWELQGGIEDYEITETEVIDINIDETIAFKASEKGGPILVVGKFYVPTTVNFIHPDENTFFYDPEDGRLLFFDTTQSQNEIQLEIDVSLSIATDEKGIPTKIKALEFRNDKFAFVELNPYANNWY